MITTIDVQGFRGIKSCSLNDLPRLALLLGPNGSGKSTFLEAAWLASASNPQVQLTHLRRRRGQIADEQRWLFNEGRIAGRCLVRINWEVDTKLHVSEVQLKRTGPHAEVSVERTSQDIDPPEARFVDQGSGAERDALHRVYSEARVRGGIDWAKGLVREVDPEIRDFEILTAHDRPELFVHYDNRSVPAALAGDGMASLIRICLEMSERKQGTVLIEEPEAHQHTASVARSARAVVAAARRGCQVILSSHSMELLDAMLAELRDEEINLLAVYRMRMSDGKTNVLRMTGERVAAARAQIADDLR